MTSRKNRMLSRKFFDVKNDTKIYVDDSHIVVILHVVDGSLSFLCSFFLCINCE